MYRLTGFAMLLCATTVHALWVPPDEKVPVSRLITNLERQLAEKPDDANLLARLGRIHSLRYALGDQQVDVKHVGGEGDLELYEHGSGYPATRHRIAGETIATRITDLHEALDYYERAVAADPDEAYIWLGLGYVRDEMSHATAYLVWPRPEQAPIQDMARHIWEEQALDAYSRAMGPAPKLSNGFLTPPVELEAARYIIAILEGRDRVSRARKALLGKARRLTEETARLPRMVTPIIFPLDSDRSLESLVEPGLTVPFDLDGTNAGLQWPWLKPDTALMVWDVGGEGDVASGCQLIGSVTWWLFWEHGYAVLGALDDNGDGWLRGSELTGLAAWQDRNSNGVSDPGEVRPLTSLGITGLATAITGTTGGMPMNHAGVEFADGRRLPSYDWIVAPAEAEK